VRWILFQGGVALFCFDAMNNINKIKGRKKKEKISNEYMFEHFFA
jgi:hypothetical protein